jgi:hypothetical protein
MTGWGRLLGWALAMLLLGWIPLAIGWAVLPDPVATHWGFGGAPNGSMQLAFVPLLQLGIVVIGLFTTSLFRVEGEPTPEAFAMLGLMGGLGLALNTSLVILNWDVESWTEAGAFSIWHLSGVLLGAFIGGLGGYMLGKKWYPVAEQVQAEGPITTVAEGERVSWIGRVAVRWPIFLLGGGAIIFVLIPGWGQWVAILFVALALMFLQVEANVNNDGLRVRLGGIPVRRIPLDKIESAQAIDLEPAAWGGWGWRVVSNGSAIVLRRGDALEVTLKGGRRFAVTVDDAATGAALLNGLVARLVSGG